ncbi:MAG: response regulator transcription factor [Actinomycetota bacterium]|nr:response regulator transcription factor [Actinomycetota bacterium]
MAEGSPHEGVRVLIADDHAAVRLGVKAALDGCGFDVCADVADGPSAVQAARELRPDVCLMDISMPGGSGIEATAEITAELPQTKVVMLTTFEDDAHLFDALRAGASGYLVKGMPEEDLPEKLRAVLDGEGVLSPGLIGRLMGEFRGRERPRRLRLRHKDADKLTPREWEILEVLQEGLSTQQVAERLSIAPVSVRSNITRILKKLRVQDRKKLMELLGQDDA